MKPIVLALGIALSIPTLSYAQSEASLCHHAGLTYSPGSMIRIGKALQKCALAEGGLSVWTPATSEDDTLESANCVSGGREFGQGSVLIVGAADLRCSNGIWYPQ